VVQQTPWAWRYTLDGITPNGGVNHVINGDTIQFYLACTEADDTVSVSFNNSVIIEKWLDHNSLAIPNQASSSAVVAAFIAELPKKVNLI